MKIIHKMLHHLEEEVEGAKEYAEKYIENKAKNNIPRATKFKEMAMDELKHASTLHEFDMADVEEIKKVYEMSDEDSTAWEHGQKHLIEQMALVKHMLEMQNGKCMLKKVDQFLTNFFGYFSALFSLFETV